MATNAGIVDGAVPTAMAVGVVWLRWQLEVGPFWGAAVVAAWTAWHRGYLAGNGRLRDGHTVCQIMAWHGHKRWDYGWGSAHGYGIWGAAVVAAWTEGGPSSSSHQQSTKPEVSALV